MRLIPAICPRRLGQPGGAPPRPDVDDVLAWNVIICMLGRYFAGPRTRREPIFGSGTTYACGNVLGNSSLRIELTRRSEAARVHEAAMFTWEIR